jgi:hypothetical protein
MFVVLSMWITLRLYGKIRFTYSTVAKITWGLSVRCTQYVDHFEAVW